MAELGFKSRPTLAAGCILTAGLSQVSCRVAWSPCLEGPQVASSQRSTAKKISEFLVQEVQGRPMRGPGGSLRKRLGHLLSIRGQAVLGGMTGNLSLSRMRVLAEADPSSEVTCLRGSSLQPCSAAAWGSGQLCSPGLGFLTGYSRRSQGEEARCWG